MRERRRLIVLLATALAGGPAAAEVRSPQTAAEVRSLNAAAQRAIKQKDYGAALTAYRQAVATLRDEPDAVAERTTAMFLAAVCLEKLDRPAEALLAHRDALEAGLAEPLAGKARARLEALRAQVVVTDAAPAEPAPGPEAPDPAPTDTATAPAVTRAPTPPAPRPTPAAPAAATPPPDSPEATLAALNERAKQAVAAERWDVALDAYREAIERLTAMPDRQQELAMTWFLVGVCLDALDRRDAADPAYAQSRALGPSPAILARIAERIGPPPTEVPGVPVELVCTPSDLAITVAGLDGASCDALRGLPAGTWRIDAEGTDGRTGSRTVHVHPDAGDYRISLVVPPLLRTPPPEVDRRAAWVLTVGALTALGAGGALIAADGDDALGPEARPVGIGLLTVGGALSVTALIAFATADSPRDPALPPGWGPVGWTF